MRLFELGQRRHIRERPAGAFGNIRRLKPAQSKQTSAKILSENEWAVVSRALKKSRLPYSLELPKTPLGGWSEYNLHWAEAALKNLVAAPHLGKSELAFLKSTLKKITAEMEKRNQSRMKQQKQSGDILSKTQIELIKNCLRQRNTPGLEQLLQKPLKSWSMAELEEVNRLLQVERMVSGIVNYVDLDITLEKIVKTLDKKVKQEFR